MISKASNCVILHIQVFPNSLFKTVADQALSVLPGMRVGVHMRLVGQRRKRDPARYAES